MKISPVKHNPEPKYPDKYAFEAWRLLYYKPVRWFSAPAAGGVLAATVLLGLTGCSGTGINRNTPDPSVTLGITADPGSMVTAGMPVPVSTDPAMKAYVPLFVHGEGTGAIGCVSVNAPQFLTEEEAKEIIKAELHAAGIGLTDGYEIENAHLPAAETLQNEVDMSFDSVSGVLETDAGTDLDIGIEFLSENDYRDLNLYGESGLSVSYFDFRSAAEKLAANENLAVFYDPAALTDLDMQTDQGLSDEERQEILQQRIEQANIESKEQSVKLLKEQVRSFIEWLEAQGVI
jgi:hypothetical protein